ncbi:MAG: hypothetical protein A3F12_06905 [Gammaproteobacteria bacterium RIFCSPHIGHO2_12_FULL_38_14]|nr:MAG: hypothetical protein A3F12_06905 [Gammaproteobacteria bacterium RIFCSPHIGHO2_12_FULL_38_14]
MKCHLFSAILLILSCVILSACASSNVSRDVSANVNEGVQNTKTIFSGTGSYDVTQSYGNASQTTKGAIIGGVAGAVASTFSSGISFFPATATGVILGATYGKYLDANMTLQDQLENRGVTVIVLGDQILIAVPSVQLFEPMTATVKPQSYSTIALIAKFVNQYTTMLVKVSGHTAMSGSDTTDIALSKQQAERIAKLLLDSGVNARLLYAEGRGGEHLVVSNALAWNESMNYRIEITLEKYYTGVI